MLRTLELQHVGPAARLHLDFAERLNLLTGDNGLGKSFLLDVAWWALTRTWAGEQAWPSQRDAPASIEAEVQGRAKRAALLTSTFDPAGERWPLGPGAPPIPGIVLYARADGGFAVWDPARNHGRGREHDPTERYRPRAYHFTKGALWNGLYASEAQFQMGLPLDSPDNPANPANRSDRIVYCNGLVRDWVSWQRADSDTFGRLAAVLQHLSPDGDEVLRPGPPRRMSRFDVREVPTLALPYGAVPLTLASAAMQRIVALCYLLVWSWQEHKRASELLGEPPEKRLVFLIDEVDAHLHPRWQRSVLPALLSVASSLTEAGAPATQLVVATHSPLVLASVEPHFDVERDRLFHLSLRDSQAVVEELPWAPQGDVVGWLVSKVFGLRQARSPEAERAIEAAEAFMRGDEAAVPDGLRSVQEIEAELRRVVPGHDPFWPRWIVRTEPVTAG